MENQKFTYSLGSIPGFTARTVRLVEKVYLQIKAQYFDGPAAVCKRRFIYLWKKPKGSDSWQSVGLFMTDDYGILFELEPFLEAIDFRKENTSIFKYNPAQQKFTERPWSLYGDAEDIIALQKHLSEPLVGMEAKSSNATEVKFNNTSLFMRPYENNELLYRDPFVVNDKYKYPFVKGTQYFMMFFPPHVVGRSAGVNTGGKVTIDQPPQLLIDNIYIVEPEDTIQDICSKFNLAPTFNLAGYKNNRSAWDEAKKRFKPGAVIAIPPQARGPLGFGRLIELLGIDRKVKLSSDWFHVDQSDNGVKDRTPVLSVELPVTLEEHTALMTENLALLDMTWSVLIEAAKPFARAANQVRSIAELVDIMRRYPGYKKRQVITRSGTGPYYSSVEYREKESYSQTELDIVNDAYDQAKIFENDLMLAAFNDQNPIFNREKEGFYALISEFEQHIKSNSLRLVLGQWATHVTSGTSATYPYLFPAEKTPLFFDILARSFQTILSIRAPYPIQHSSEELRTVGDAIFENILSRFELHLQAAFQVADRTGTIQKAVLDEMKTLGLVSESTAAIFDKETYLPQRYEDGGDLLAFIFSDIVLKKGIAGMDNCVETILKAGTEFRTKMIRYHCRNKGIKASFTYFKIAAGLKLRSGKASSQVINDAKAGLSFLSKERKRYADIAKDINIRSKKHLESITAVPQLSLTANAVTAGMAIYSMVDFANKLQSARNNNQKVSFDDWIGFASSLHSFGSVAAGFTNSMLRSTDAVLQAQEFLEVSIDRLTNNGSVRSKVAGFADSAAKKLGTAGLAFSVYDLYKAYEKSMGTARTGDTVQASLRWVQFGLGAASTAASLIPGGVLVSLALEGTNLAISSYIQLRESLKTGVESLIANINKELSNSTLLRSKHIELMSDKKYYLASDREFVRVKLSGEQYTVGKHILDSLGALQDALKIRYVNIDPVSGGAVLLNRGYSIDEVGLIVAKQKQLNRYEVNFMEGFSQTGVFDLRDCNLQVASGKYRYPDEDYLTENNGSKWLYYDPAQYFRKLYPWTKVNLSQY